ncbi:chemotaxis protein CheD [Alteromonas oceani]|uniref:Probable chemoreceptor glutamine deamidase CheD n=1 Tax=Alteromonas oceani TaxID=2071609 RepID=A0ABV7JZM3_9ALTE|nr:chemotaxis protein CheD [Alteromonas oceani]
MPPRKKVHLHAGDYCFGEANLELHTLLGSCVSVTLWHPELKIGGMCHFALPVRKDEPGDKLNPRYGSDCFGLFQRSVARYQIPLSEFEAKIFGGGNILNNTSSKAFASVQKTPVGDKNVQVAFEFLMANNIEMKVAHVGESGYRKIIFDVASGDVWVKFTPVENVGDQNSLTGKT